MLTLLGALSLPLGCGSPAPGEPIRDATLEPCVQAYQGTIASLGAMLAASGRTDPAFPPVEDYVIRCRALGLDDRALLCLDPKVAVAEPDRCTAALDSVRPSVEALSAWFAEQILPAPKPRTPEPEPVPTGGQP